MIRQIYLQIPMDQILTGWARRVDQEDVRNFVSVFVTAKKSGGDSLAVIRDSISQIRDKMEIAAGDRYDPRCEEVRVPGDVLHPLPGSSPI